MGEAKKWEQWQLDGSIPQAYEDYLVPAIFVPWTRHALRLAPLSAGQRVLDIACGTGILARHAAAVLNHTGTVVGLDLSQEMLDIAHSASVASGLTIDWRLGSAQALPLPDASIDIVFCQFGLQFFPDKLLALQEMRRVLASGGRLLISLPRAIEHWPATAALANALEKHVGGEAAAMMRAPFAYADHAEIREIIEAAGFERVSVDIAIETLRFGSAEEFIQRQIAASPLSGPVSALSDQVRKALFAEASLAMAGHIADAGFAAPMQAHFALAAR